MTFLQKNFAFNVDEIDTWRQFHQHFTRAFFAFVCFEFGFERTLVRKMCA